VVHGHGVAHAPINHTCGGVLHVVGTRGTPKCTATVCFKPPDADEQPIIFGGGVV